MSILGALARKTEPFRVWFHWPFVPALAIILGHRENMREDNLTDLQHSPPDPPEPEIDFTAARTISGSHNDLAQPWMGMAGARFGRNVAPAAAFGEQMPELMEPSPRLVSNKLLARRQFVPVEHLNVLAAAWIQFMVHDWLSHGAGDPNDLHDVPLPDGDPWLGGKMQVPRTIPEPGEDGQPTAYTNIETHWWDASQIYGSDSTVNRAVRTDETGRFLADGTLALDDRGLLPIDTTERRGTELAGVNANWWIGLSVLHTIFAREHNAVVARLRLDHPEADGSWLYDKARLVVSALIAKIHTVEWTPALMDSPEGRMAMRGNYWGLMGERVFKSFGRLSRSEVISGIPGSPQDHHTAPYAMTEEFTAVYRLHSLMPDTYSFRRATDDSEILTADLAGVSLEATRGLYDHMSFDDALYSLCTENPGALCLHNYPQGLRELTKENGRTVDLASIDILRDRERGVPRFAEFRRQLGMKVPTSFEDITSNKEWQRDLREVYGSVGKVDLLVGCLAESQSNRGMPPRFGFSDTAFRIFILMASRRLKSDRFFTDDFRPAIYTQAGYDWVINNNFRTVLRRHCPALNAAWADLRNPFFPWSRS
ncbi:MAG: peroxidase family protein [Pseudomonadota bacterium]